MKHTAFAIASILLMCAFVIGCSRDDSADVKAAKPSTPDEPTEDAAAISELSLLDPSRWSLVKWNSRNIDESVAETEASLETDSQGILAKTNKKFQRVQVLLQMELFDDFEVHLRGVSPSSEELQAAGVSNPTRQSPLIGFRSANGHPMFRTHIKARWDRRDEFEATVRRCQGVLSIWVDGDRTVHLPNFNISSGYVFLELGSPTHLHITDCEVLEGVEPDPVKDKTPAASAPSSSMAGPPPTMMPPMGFPGPMSPGAGAPFPIQAPPQPSRGEPLKSNGDWYVPKLGNTRMDSVIAQDVRFADEDRGWKISKTNASGTLWLVRKLSTEDDFEATAYVTLPSMQTVMASGDPRSMIGFGVYPTQADANGISIPSPPPMPTTTRDVSVTFRRVKGRVEMQVDGIRTGSQAVRIDGPVILGFLMQGSIHFWIRDFRMSTKDKTDEVSPTRTWTEASGERTVVATFLRLDGETVHVRREDGREIAVPISALSEADQKVARELAQRQDSTDVGSQDR